MRILVMVCGQGQSIRYMTTPVIYAPRPCHPVRALQAQQPGKTLACRLSMWHGTKVALHCWMQWNAGCIFLGRDWEGQGKQRCGLCRKNIGENIGENIELCTHALHLLVYMMTPWPIMQRCSASAKQVGQLTEYMYLVPRAEQTKAGTQSLTWRSTVFSLLWRRLRVHRKCPQRRRHPIIAASG